MTGEHDQRDQTGCVIMENIINYEYRMELISAGPVCTVGELTAANPLAARRLPTSPPVPAAQDSPAALFQPASGASSAASGPKIAYLANMSHQIRTPMNSILGFAQLLLRDMALSADQRRNVVEISRSGEHLLALLNDILELARMEAGPLALNPTSQSIRGLLEDLATTFRHRCDAKNLVLRLSVASDLPTKVIIDDGKLRRLLTHLLSNAVKFTEFGGIQLRSGVCQTPAGRRLYFEVEDTGAGIAPEEIERVFIPFSHPQARQRKAGGTGLGLCISRAFARAMGGDMVVSSNLGSGSVFRVEISLIADESGSGESPFSGSAGAPRTGEHRVLVVDDEDANRRILSAMLGSAGMVIREAGSGEEALTIVKDWVPDVVLLDMTMPGIDGYETALRMRANEALTSAVIIVVTANAFPESREAMFSARVDDLLMKPVRFGELMRKLKQHLGYDPELAQEQPPAEGDKHSGASERPMADAIASLPSGLVREMAEAIRAGNRGAFLKILGKIVVSEPELARKLRELADQYDYDALLALLENGPRQP